MWQARCILPPEKSCARSSCLHPAVCPFFALNQGRGARLLRDIAALKGVRHVRVASGVRFDLALLDPEALRAYVLDFAGGRIKVAPEHTAPAVLSLMRKPSLPVFEAFLEEASRGLPGGTPSMEPYIMSAFPGCTEDDMRSLAAWLRRRRWKPRQVQCFIPTPGTVATAMFYSGLDLRGQPLPVARTDRERLRQHHLLLDGEEKQNPVGRRKHR
jgi:radical SAM superfamily enzyme YgiQ (UPF0313 family)